MSVLSPRPVKTILLADPDDRPGDRDMEFRLTYEGELLGASRANTRPKHKHEIRRVFHKQLKRLWDILPELRQTLQVSNLPGSVGWTNVPMVETVAQNFKSNGYRFVPLVTEQLALLCRLDVLFLRPDPPGSLVQSGDLDNRIKTIFDALRMPSHAGELGGYTVPQEGEDPFFCLLQDDKLITRISVETDTLLEPIGFEHSINDARLVISVTVRPTYVTISNTGFL